jgi:hypothetical protein
MKFDEHISWLARVNSGKCYPKRTLDEVDTSLPYFKLSKDMMGKYAWEPFNFETHDNAPRMPYVARYLLNNVFPHVKGDLSGYYNIQLHDHFSYLKDGKCYDNVLCFGSTKRSFVDSKWAVQLPDCYFMGNWGGKYDGSGEDTMSWDNKKKRIIFAGTTTGSRVPLENERIKTCLWALDKGREEFCDFWITKIAQIDAKRIFAEVPRFRYVFRPPVPLDEQMTYKYMLGIDGNTCRWNPDVYFMKTLSLCLPSRDMLWYSPMLKDGEHYVEVNTQDDDPRNLTRMFTYYENNGNEAMRIIQNANQLAQRLFKTEVCQQYTKELFDNIAENKA